MKGFPTVIKRPIEGWKPPFCILCSNCVECGSPCGLQHDEEFIAADSPANDIRVEQTPSG